MIVSRLVGFSVMEVVKVFPFRSTVSRHLDHYRRPLEARGGGVTDRSRVGVKGVPHSTGGKTTWRPGACTTPIPSWRYVLIDHIVVSA